MTRLPSDRYHVPSMSETKLPFTQSKSTIELYSPQYFYTCALGGVLACGPTHSGVTPLDLVKCRTQVKPDLYKGIFDGWRTILKTDGFRGLWVGLGPTFVGYSLQGAGKYGLYEFFKYSYGNFLGEEKAYQHRSLVALAASGSAEFIADIFLCPLEALKVRMQLSYPPYATSGIEGFHKLKTNEGLRGFYKGLVPLWSRQIPYTMMKFMTFEKTVELIYSNLLSKPKEEYNKLQQLIVSFSAGYTSGILVALVSHPADVIVSGMNAASDKPGEKKVSMVEMAKNLGLKGVWRGLGPRVMMIGTLTSFQWLIYDTFKVYMGLPTTGAAKKE